MSLKQRLHFGSKAQRAAARRSMSAKRKRKTSARPHRVRTTVRQKRRSNPGEIVSLVLGNPAKRRKNTMAKAKTVRRRRKSNAGTAPRRRRRTVARRHHTVHHRRRSNPARRRRTYARRSNPGRMSNLIKSAIGAGIGAVGSKLATQMVLGSSNTGIMGYVGNAVSTGLISWGAKMVTKDHDITYGILVGGALQILLRAIGDFTPYGSYLSGTGMGDYMAANFVTPQRLPDALNSAMVQIPNGWAPTTVISGNGAGASLGSIQGPPLW